MANSLSDVLQIARVAIAIPVKRLFDYLIPDELASIELQLGMRVQVPFGAKHKIGYLVEIATHSEVAVDKLKPISAILDNPSLLSEYDLQLLHWASRYYYHPLGEVFNTAFPVALRKGKASRLKVSKYYRLTTEGLNFDVAKLYKLPKQQLLLSQLQAEPELEYSARDFTHYGSAWRSMVNSFIKKGFLSEATKNTDSLLPLTRQASLVANAEQLHAIQQVCAHLQQFTVYLLEGVTGSGKTEVYMQIIQTVLEAGQQVLVLLPEITLTPQLEARFKQRFNVSIAISHSRLTEMQRHAAWLSMQQGIGRILLGTRSALFTPFKNPGLFILDEEHDSSFKQQEGFRFSARDVAIMRAKMLNIPIMLGSATPSLESIENVNQGRYQRLHLPQRAGSAIEPTFLVLDIRNKKLQEGFSPQLLAAIKDTLAKREQVLIFLNRRGFAPVLICHSCGWIARCWQCDANLVIHYDERRLACHHCGVTQSLPKQCPSCHKTELHPLGLGTERVEKVLQALFPEQRVVRLDRDTTKLKGALEGYLEQINQDQVDIILGTQMLAKGHHFPNVTLVAMLDVDSGLFSVDFHASEKLAQLIMQVAGRAGRAQKPGKVLLQTRQPEHPFLQTLIRNGYGSFAALALEERKLAKLPPFSYQALLRAYSTDPKAPLLFLEAVSALVKQLPVTDLLMLGPVAAPMARRAGDYRYQLLLQAERRAHLHAVLEMVVPEFDKLPLIKRVAWSLDIDPIDLY